MRRVGDRTPLLESHVRRWRWRHTYKVTEVLEVTTWPSNFLTKSPLTPSELHKRSRGTRKEKSVKRRRLDFVLSLKAETTPTSLSRPRKVEEWSFLTLHRRVHVLVHGHLLHRVHEGLGERLFPHLVAQVRRHPHPLVETVVVLVQVYERGECQ